MSKQKFRIISLFLVLAALVWSCDKPPSDFPDQYENVPLDQSLPLVHIFYQSDDSVSQATTGHITQTLRYAKLPYSTADINGVTDAEIPGTAKTAFLTTSLTEMDQSFIQKLVQFVNRGNNLIMTRPLWDNRTMFLQGINPSASLLADTTASGIIFKTEVFPKFQGVADSLTWPDPHAGFTNSVFKPDVKVLASARFPRSYPVIVQNDIGAGSVFLYNSSIFGNQNFGSLFFSNLLKTLPGVPYPVTNVSTIFLDDFPAPFYNIESQPIYEEYELNMAQFVYQIWWPDIKELANQFDISYTTALVFNYNAKTIPPFDFTEWRIGKVRVGNDSVNVSQWLAEDVLRSRHELGYHGYNHTSLNLENWENERYMYLSVDAARRMWLIQGLGDYPTTYIPPHNSIDSTGLQSVIRGMKSLTLLTSTTTAGVPEGGGREFGPDSYLPQLYSYPRSTSGFYNQNSSVFAQHSQTLPTGVWNHFIHPDDVYDITTGGKYSEFGVRNPLRLGWKHGLGRGEEGLYQKFRKRLQNTKQWYPHMQFITAKEGAQRVRSTLSKQYQRSVSNDSLTISSTGGEQHWFMYVPEGEDAAMEQRVRAISSEFAKTTIWEGYLYQFSSDKPNLTFPSLKSSQNFGQELTINDLNSQVSNFERVRNLTQNPDIVYDQQNLDSLKTIYAQNPSTEELDKLVRVSTGINQTNEAVTVLEERMRNKHQWDTMTLERLLTFYGWQGISSATAWELLEERWTLYPDDTTVRFKNRLVDEYGWPDTETQQTWLLRLHKLYPDSTQITRRVAFNFANDSTWHIAENATDDLIKKIPRSDTLYAFKLQRTMWYDTTRVLSVLETFPPHSYPQLRPFSDELAYMYADQREDYPTALNWAERAFTFDPSTKLYWVELQGDSTLWRKEALNTLEQYSRVDSIRANIGLNLLYRGFTEDAYPILHPFMVDLKRDSIDTIVHTEMSYLPYEQQLEMYNTYPSFFPDTLRQQIFDQYEAQRNITVSPHASYSDDNFDNTVSEVGVNASWEYNARDEHTLNVSEVFVGSVVNQQQLQGRLYHINYDYSRNFLEEQLLAHVSGGLQYRNENLFPSLASGASYATDSSFTSLELYYRPVYTNTAIENGIKELTAELYREEPWFGGELTTAVSGRARYFTDNVFHYEASLTGQIFPFTIGNFNAAMIGYVSYGDATVSRISGVPYYTPDNLITRGGGFMASYTIPDNNINFQLQGRANRDNTSPLFTTLSATVSTPVIGPLSLELQGYYSTSETYRTNEVSFSLNFDIPKRLTPVSPVRPTYSYRAPESIREYRGDPSEPYNILGQVAMQDTTAFGSLYNHTVKYSNQSGTYTGTAQTYYDGSFFINDLAPGTYYLWAEAKDTTMTVVEDSLTVTLNDQMEQQTRTGINFSLALSETEIVQPEAVQEDTTGDYYVAYNYVDSLSQAISLVTRYRDQFDLPVNMYYNETRQLIQLRTDSIEERENAFNTRQKIREVINEGFVDVKVDTGTAWLPMTYQFQFGSFQDEGNAREFAAGIRDQITDYSVNITIDPVMGLFIVGTESMTDWQNSEAKLEQLKQKIGEDRVFRRIEPRITIQ